MRAHGSKSGVKNKTPKSPETREYLGKIRIFLLLNSNFPHKKIDFLQWLSNFRKIQENLLQWLSAFFNSFPISSTTFEFSSMAFCFPRNMRKSIYGGKYMKDHYLSFVFPATCSPSFVIPAN
jgi:hypothetical protein